MIATFIDPGDGRWTEVLSRVRHDVYHTPEYVAFAARHEGGAPAAFYAEEGPSVFLAPLLLRPLPQTLMVDPCWGDAAAPYGCPSPILDPPEDARSLTAFLRAFRALGRRRGLVSAFFRLHPLLALPDDVLEHHGTVVKHGPAVYLDLTLPVDAMWSATRENHRRDIRRLIRSGFVASMDDWTRFQEFIAIYGATMERLSAREYYRFSDRY